MIGLWLMAILPLLAGGILHLKFKEVTLGEWLAGVGVGLLTCAILQWIAVSAMTSDTECWSGQIVSARYDPAFTQWYMQAHHHSSGTGKNRRTWTTYTKERRHIPDSWEANDNLGNSRGISRDRYENIETCLGPADKKTGLKHNFDSGNPDTHIVSNKTGYAYPTTSIKSWSNRVKAAPSVFSFERIPEGTKGLYEWPANSNWFSPSGRLLGTATDLGVLPWDQMNSFAGFRMHANVIAIGFGEQASSDIAHLQEAKWIGGKKNDLVICYGGGTRQQPSWAYCFGWTESELIKRNLETMFLKGPVNSGLVPKVQDEVRQNFKPKDWHKFDYITIEPPAWAYITLFLTMALTQGLWWMFAYGNEWKKEVAQKFGRRYDYR